jgi:hypothetical protein
MKKSVFNRLRELRQERGLTQEQLAADLEVTRHTVTKSASVVGDSPTWHRKGCLERWRSCHGGSLMPPLVGSTKHALVS